MMDFDEIFKLARKKLAENGEHDMQILLENQDGNSLDLLDFEDKTLSMDESLSDLKDVLEHEDRERYYVAFCGSAVNKDEEREFVEELFADVSDEKSFIKFLSKIAQLVSLSPSEHPCKRDTFVLLRCDKKTGTDIRGEYYEIDDEGNVLLTGETIPQGGESGYYKMNVWNPLQVNLDESEDEDGR